MITKSTMEILRSGLKWCIIALGITLIVLMVIGLLAFGMYVLGALLAY